jgi:hypothetical protein
MITNPAWLDPPAIIIPGPADYAEMRTIIAQQTVSPVHAEEYFRELYDRPWNTEQEDGRINMGNDTSASVSPYSTHFQSQVEAGVWPLVERLYLKGYLPVSSCQGHRGNLWDELDTLFLYRSTPYVSIAIKDSELDYYVDHIRSLTPKWARVTTVLSQANTNGSSSDGKSVRLRYSDRPAARESEAFSLNYMMQRNYPLWAYINITINPWRRFNPLHLLRTQRELDLIQELADRYTQLEPYSL